MRARFADRPLPLLVSSGLAPCYIEIQDVVTRPLRVPTPVRLWANYADPVDVATLDTSLSDNPARFWVRSCLLADASGAPVLRD